MMMKMMTRVGPGLLLTVALASCGGSSEAKSKVASLGGGTTTTTKAGATSDTDFQTAMLAYAKCMRTNGVDMADPQFGADGRPSFQGGTGQATGQAGGGPFAGLRDDPDFEKAQAACQSITDGIRQSFQGTPEEQAKRQKDQLAFAKCMRAAGFEYADPQFDADGRPVFNQTQRDNAEKNRNDPKFQTASTDCRTKLGITGGGPGGGGGFGPRPNGSGTATTPTTKAS